MNMIIGDIITNMPIDIRENTESSIKTELSALIINTEEPFENTDIKSSYVDDDGEFMVGLNGQLYYHDDNSNVITPISYNNIINNSTDKEIKKIIKEHKLNETESAKLLPKKHKPTKPLKKYNTPQDNYLDNIRYLVIFILSIIFMIILVLKMTLQLYLVKNQLKLKNN